MASKNPTRSTQRKVIFFMKHGSTLPPPDFQKYQGPFPKIDISKTDGTSRWQEVLQNDSDLQAARLLFKAGWKEFPLEARTRADDFASLYRFFDGPFASELHAWADALGQPIGAVAMVNCSYEFDHLADTFSFCGFLKLVWRKIFGCTSAVIQIQNGETVQVRNLDWPIAGMGSATRIFEFVGGKHSFRIVGFPGFLGALSGVVPGQYSATINWAPPQQMPSFDYAPVFLLRKVLQECSTYEAACKLLREETLSTSVFYTVCGLKEGCVIERTPDDFAERPLTAGFVAQTNHHVADQFQQNNKMLARLRRKDFLIKTTENRLRDTASSIQDSNVINKAWSEPTLFAALNRGDVTNYQTTQRMIFRPRTGDIFLEIAA